MTIRAYLEPVSITDIKKPKLIKNPIPGAPAWETYAFDLKLHDQEIAPFIILDQSIIKLGLPEAVLTHVRLLTLFEHIECSSATGNAPRVTGRYKIGSAEGVVEMSPDGNRYRLELCAPTISSLNELYLAIRQGGVAPMISFSAPQIEKPLVSLRNMFADLLRRMADWFTHRTAMYNNVVLK